MEATQATVYAVVRRVIADREEARDAVQEVYLRAFKSLHTLRSAGAFDAWLRRIAVTTAIDLARKRCVAFVADTDVLAVPVLDEHETHWTDAQRRALSRALLTLRPADRRLCDRYYYGRAPTATLAQDAECTEAAMRKRLQRIRDQLRKEIEMIEQRYTAGEPLPDDLPEKIVELLARPIFTDVPENPVGAMWQEIRSSLSHFELVNLEETVALDQIASVVGSDRAKHLPRDVFHVDQHKILRPEMSLPMLLRASQTPGEQRLIGAGKVYRDDPVDQTHLQVFHQAELLLVAEGIDEWALTGWLTALIQQLLRGARVRIDQENYPLICQRGWDMQVCCAGKWCQIGGWGLYHDDIARRISGGNRMQAVGMGLGLERIAALRYGVDDLRKVEGAHL